MTEPDSILEWSKIASQIELKKREIKETILKENGISEDAFKDLQTVVMSELEKRNGNVIENEYGQIRGKWSYLKDREGKLKELKISRCFIIPKVKK